MSLKTINQEKTKLTIVYNRNLNENLRPPKTLKCFPLSLAPAQVSITN